MESDCATSPKVVRSLADMLDMDKDWTVVRKALSSLWTDVLEDSDCAAERKSFSSLVRKPFIVICWMDALAAVIILPTESVIPTDMLVAIEFSTGILNLSVVTANIRLICCERFLNNMAVREDIAVKVSARTDDL